MPSKERVYPQHAAAKFGKALRHVFSAAGAWVQLAASHQRKLQEVWLVEHEERFLKGACGLGRKGPMGIPAQEFLHSPAS